LDAFKPLVAEKKVNLLFEDNAKKHREFGHSGLGCMKFSDELRPVIEKIFYDHHFLE
jgi:hypothetical protein